MMEFAIYCPGCGKNVGHINVAGQVEKKLNQLEDIKKSVGTWLAAVESADLDAEASAAEYLAGVYERCVK